MIKVSTKIKFLILGLVVGFWAIILFIGIGMCIPGMGMDSQKFINSVENKANELMPEGRYTISTDQAKRKLAKTSLQSTYEADALSALSPDATDTQKEAVKNESDKWFEDKWASYFPELSEDGSIVTAKELDINWIVKDLVNFDIHMSDFLEEYSYRYGFTHAGIQWIFKPNIISELLSVNFKNTEIYNDAKLQQTVIDQKKYDESVDAELGKLYNEITVNNGGGTYIANNKAWFLNKQKEVIEKTTTSAITKDIIIINDSNGNQVEYSDAEDFIENNWSEVQPTDFAIPNYTHDIEVLRAGIVILIIITPILALPTICVSLLLFFPKNKN